MPKSTKSKSTPILPIVSDLPPWEVQPGDSPATMDLRALLYPHRPNPDSQVETPVCNEGACKKCELSVGGQINPQSKFCAGDCIRIGPRAGFFANTPEQKAHTRHGSQFTNVGNGNSSSTPNTMMN